MTMNLLNENLLSGEALERAKHIKMLVLDVDGVLSDGRITFSASGEESKSFNTLDGQGIRLLQKGGVEVAIITGRKSAIVERRCAELGITLLAQGREDKFVALQELLATLEQPPQLHEIAHMGDDLPDLLVMQKVGLALTVADGHHEVAARAHWSSKRLGGTGAVREACDALLVAQGQYDNVVGYYTHK